MNNRYRSLGEAYIYKIYDGKLREYHGEVMSKETGKMSDIIVKAKAPNAIKEILVGGGLIVGGIIYLTSKAFRNGAQGFSDAELEALCNIGAID